MFWKRTKVKQYDDLNDENHIVVVHREEASPASTMRFIIAALFLVLAAVTIGQQMYFQGQRSSDLKTQQAIDKEFRDDQELLNTQLQQQINDADLDREALRNLIIGVLTAKTPAEGRKLLEDFVAESKKRDRARASASPRPGASPSPKGGKGGKPSPKPSPTHKPSPKPSPSPSCILPSPVPRLPVVCK